MQLPPHQHCLVKSLVDGQAALLRAVTCTVRGCCVCRSPWWAITEPSTAAHGYPVKLLHQHRNRAQGGELLGKGHWRAGKNSTSLGWAESQAGGLERTRTLLCKEQGWFKSWGCGGHSSDQTPPLILHCSSIRRGNQVHTQRLILSETEALQNLPWIKHVSEVF